MTSQRKGAVAGCAEPCKYFSFIPSEDPGGLSAEDMTWSDLCFNGLFWLCKWGRLSLFSLF